MSPLDSVLIQASGIIYVTDEIKAGFEPKSIAMKRIRFKFLGVGSCNNGGEVCLERLCDLFSICDATCELNWAHLVGERIVPLSVNPSHLKQTLHTNFIQGRTELKLERILLNIETQTS